MVTGFLVQSMVIFAVRPFEGLGWPPSSQTDSVQTRVESGGGAVTKGEPCVLPALSVAGARVAPHAPSPPPAPRTGRADLPHPALGPGLMRSPTDGAVAAVPGATPVPVPRAGNGPSSVPASGPALGTCDPATAGADVPCT